MTELSNLLAFIDLETTGLDPAEASILEIAVIVTDGDLHSANVGPNLVLHAETREMPEVVREMHTTSGLLDDVAQSGLKVWDAERQVLEFLREFDEPGKIPLAGSSVHFDRKFLAYHMPDLEAWFHYRNVDASSLGEVMRRWFPAIHARAPEKREIHRAFADIQDSIRLMRYYRNSLGPREEKTALRKGW